MNHVRNSNYINGSREISNVVKRIFILVAIFFAIVFFCTVYLSHNYQTPILMYHSLNAARVNDYAAVSPQVFLKQMEYIAKHKYRVFSLRDYCQLLKAGRPVPRKMVVLTFDDGHKDNLAAFKILERFAFPAIFFIIVDKINNPGYLSRIEIAEALKNSQFSIGSHTVSEAYLPDLEGEELSYEVKSSKAILEELFLKKVEAISYTIGGYNQQVLKEVASAGYLCACTTNRGFSKKIDRFALRRIKITNRDSGVRLWAKLSGFYNVFKKPKQPH